jgi:hypothetical protein
MIFAHSRDLGDIVYSLDAIKALGGGQLHLTVNPKYTLHGMTPWRVDFIRPLLEAQPYITRVVYPGDPDEKPDVDFSDILPRWNTHRNLHECHLALAGLDGRVCRGPWLTLPEPAKQNGYVIAAYSPRRPNLFFPWKAIHDRLVSEKNFYPMLFIGLESEQKKLKEEHGVDLPWQQTANALYMAELIAGCKLFIGSSSLPLAIAEGLGVPVLAALDGNHHDSHHCRAKRWECSTMGCDYESIFAELGL